MPSYFCFFVAGVDETGVALCGSSNVSEWACALAQPAVDALFLGGVYVSVTSLAFPAGM